MFKVVRRRRVVLASSTAVAVLAGLTLWGAVEAVASSPAPAASGDGSRSAASASARAAETGEPVEVLEARDEYSTTFANPDGTFRLDESTAPQRVRTGDGSWVPPDATLVRRPDGSVAPRAAVAELSFSGGGDGARLIRMGRHGRWLQLGWPGSLPVPQLDGATAIYPEVLAGVDLRLTATTEGYRQVLVVKSAQAAANPALARVRLAMASEGLRVVPGPGGGLRALDADGNTVLAGPPGLMWDSAGDREQQGAAASAPGVRTAVPRSEPVGPDGGPLDPTAGPNGGDAVAELPVQVSGAAVAVVPDADLLRGDRTVFPLYIDPPVGASLAERLMVGSNGEHAWQFSGDEGVGHCGTYLGYRCGSGYTKRMLFEFTPGRLAGKHVLGATFRAYELWSMSCTPSSVSLERTGDISTATRWPGPASVDHLGDRDVAYGRGTACDPDRPAAWVEFKDSSSEPDENLTGTVRAFADGRWPRLTLMLRAGNESDPNSWKRFRHDATLQVTYVPKPGVPTGTGVQPTNDPRSTTCRTLAQAVTSASPTPTVRAVAQTAVPPAALEDKGSLRVEFAVEKFVSSNNTWSAAWGGAAPATGWDPDNTAESRSTSALADNTTYRLHARTRSHWAHGGKSGDLVSGFSPWCHFKVDSSAPKPPQVIADPQGPYTQCMDEKQESMCVPGGGPGVTGPFTFRPDGADTSVTAYRWHLLGSEFTQVAGATQSVAVTPPLAGVEKLTVEAKDIFDRWGSPTVFAFRVRAPQGAVGRWQFAQSAGSTVLDSATVGPRHPLTVAGGAAFDERGRRGNLAGDQADHALGLDGTAAYAATADPVVNTAESFTISASVYLAGRDRAQTVLSQRGATARVLRSPTRPGPVGPSAGTGRTHPGCGTRSVRWPA